MDEVKRGHEIDAAMRELVRRRDEALREAPSLSSGRRSALTALLARHFPVELILRDVLVTRDEALHPRPPKISAAVESTLVRQLATVRPRSDRGRTPLWLSPLRLPLAAGLTVCVLITFALLRLGRWETSRSNAGGASTGPSLDTMTLEAGMEPFVRTIAIGPFNLNTNEPASLQVSSFTSRRIRFSDGKNTSLGLRLDLPMTAAFMEDGLGRMP